MVARWWSVVISYPRLEQHVKLLGLFFWALLLLHFHNYNTNHFNLLKLCSDLHFSPRKYTPNKALACSSGAICITFTVQTHIYNYICYSLLYLTFKYLHMVNYLKTSVAFISVFSVKTTPTNIMNMNYIKPAGQGFYFWKRLKFKLWKKKERDSLFRLIPLSLHVFTI